MVKNQFRPALSAFLLMVTMSLLSTALSFFVVPVCEDLGFGGRDYAAIWSVVISCSSVSSFLAAPLWGMVYDFCGSYGPGLLSMPLLLAAGIFCLLGAFRNIED